MRIRRLYLPLVVAMCTMTTHLMFAQAATTVSQAYISNARIGTNLSHVHTFADAPKDFNPLSASDDDLAFYGYPPRPDAQAEPDHFAMWSRAMQAAKIRWHGELKALPPTARSSSNMQMPPVAVASSKKTTYPATPTSLNWAGVVLTKNLSHWSASQSFRDIYSMMTVPTGQPAFGGGCDNYTQLTWAGLNGYIKNNAVQPGASRGALMGGVASFSTCSSAQSAYGAVFGWDPSYMQVAFDVNPGDMVYTEVGAPSDGVNSSYLFIEDLTTLNYNAFSVAVPYIYNFVGDSAEWVVERRCCYDTGYPLPLLNTIDTFFDGGAALDNAGNTLYPGSQATSTQVLTMRDDKNDQNIELIYQGSAGYEGTHSLLMQTTGCAYTGGCVKE